MLNHRYAPRGQHTGRNLAAAFALLIALGGCQGSEKAAEKAPDPDAVPEQSYAAQAAKLDQGPRAAAVLVPDAAAAERGAGLFVQYSCSDCHELGSSEASPDLRGVLDRRTLPWLMKQIIEPEWMNAHDPIARQLIRQYELEMVTADVTVADAEAILQFLLREAGPAAP